VRLSASATCALHCSPGCAARGFVLQDVLRAGGVACAERDWRLPYGPQARFLWSFEWLVPFSPAYAAVVR